MAEADNSKPLVAVIMGSTAYGIWQPWWMAGFLSAALMLRLATRIGARIGDKNR